MTVAPATAPALRDEIATALEHDAPAHRKVVVSLIERRLDPETANYRYGEVMDVPTGSGRQWGLWLKVAGCGPC